MSDLPWHFLDLDVPALQERSRGEGIRVALLDTGVAPTDGLFTSFRALSPDGSAVDSIDDDGHGTACASVIASLDDGAPGVAPNVELVSIRVTAGGAPVESLARQAFSTALRNGCHVISCSFTLEQAETATLDAIRSVCNRGVVVVAASGNDPAVASAFPERTPNVLVVGAYGRGREALDGRIGLFTDVLAPGADLPIVGRDGSRSFFGQSSGAAAVTAGIVALVLSATRDKGTAKVGLAIEGLAKSTAEASGDSRLLDPTRLLAAADRIS